MSNKKHSSTPSWLATALTKSSLNKQPRTTVIIKESQDQTASKPQLTEGKNGWKVIVTCPKAQTSNSWLSLDQMSPWTAGRDGLGDALRALNAVPKASILEVLVESKNEDFLNGVVMGLELSSYSFKNLKPAYEKVSLQWNKKILDVKDVALISQLGTATNWARHLVNLPPNDLHPESYADLLKNVFSKMASVKVEVWNTKKLAQENCNLHLSVGQGAHSKPRLVILRYRPKKAKNKKPIALVGKGITFDSGGLDIKPSAGMRLMKKDMGGSAAVVGTMLFAATSKIPLNIDAYLAIAENSVSSTSFRPSDVVTARSGKRIEIHNTDAEGRLVLADALDVAQDSKNKPEVIVDVATLTGAIKISLGAGVAGLFSNNSDLGKELFEHFHEAGDDCWPMPLYQKYRSSMTSNFADMTNSVDGFGGAITAALFLESFIKDQTPWAHLDIYAWKDGPQGAWLESGGSGQAVQGLCRWLLSKA